MRALASCNLSSWRTDPGNGALIPDFQCGPASLSFWVQLRSLFCEPRDMYPCQGTLGCYNTRSLLTSHPIQFGSVQSLSRVWLFATPWTAACQASLYITNSRSLIKLMSIESVMPSNHLILCCPLLLLPSIFPSIRGFSNELALWIVHYFSCNRGWERELAECCLDNRSKLFFS